MDEVLAPLRDLAAAVDVVSTDDQHERQLVLLLAVPLVFMTALAGFIALDPSEAGADVRSLAGDRPWRLRDQRRRDARQNTSTSPGYSTP